MVTVAPPMKEPHVQRLANRPLVLADAAIVLLILGLATDVGIFGWVLAILLGAYVVVAIARADDLAK